MSSPPKDQATRGRPWLSLSVDLELIWGFSHEDDPVRASRLHGVGREHVFMLLDILDGLEVPMSWLTVGHLLLQREEAIRLVTPDLPQFSGGHISWSKYVTIRDHPLATAPDLVEEIRSRGFHEVGLHGFLHLPFHRIDDASAREELSLGVRAASLRGVEVRSFAFPYNCRSKLWLLRSLGLEVVRSGIRCSHLAQLIREGLTRLGLRRRGVRRRKGLWLVDSYYLDTAPGTDTVDILLSELESRGAQVIHFWFHPWNLSRGEEGLLEFLRTIRRLEREGRLEIGTLGDVPHL